MVRTSTADTRAPAAGPAPAFLVTASADQLAASSGLAVTPFVIAVDTREQAPYYFNNIPATGSKDRGKRLLVQLQTKTLDTGDYSIVGFESLIAVERKSKEDIYSTLGGRRAQFEAEHARMQLIKRNNGGRGFAAVVIEATLEDAMLNPPVQSRLPPNSVHGTFVAWTQRYEVPWFWVGERRIAEITVFRMMERFWTDRMEAQREAERLKMPLFD